MPRQLLYLSTIFPMIQGRLLCRCRIAKKLHRVPTIFSSPARTNNSHCHQSWRPQHDDLKETSRCLSPYSPRYRSTLDRTSLALKNKKTIIKCDLVVVNNHLKKMRKLKFITKVFLEYLSRYIFHVGFVSLS